MVVNIKNYKTIIILTESDKKNKWNITENHLRFNNTIKHVKYYNLSLQEYAKIKETRDIKSKPKHKKYIYNN